MKKSLLFLLLSAGIIGVVVFGFRPNLTTQASSDINGRIDDDPGLVAQTNLFARMAADRHPNENLPALAEVPCENGTADIYSCANVDLLAFMPLSTIGGGSGNDLWGWTDSTTGKEYVLMGRSSGTAFVDVSDPVNPVYLGDLPTHTSSSSWRDIKVYADHAYIVSEAGGHGMQVFDLTQLAGVTNPPMTFAATAHYDGFGNAHNIVINEETGFAYAVGTARNGPCSGGLYALDLSDPVDPMYVGCFDNDGYTHDAHCVIYDGPDIAFVGQEICINSNEDTITIVDMTNKNSMVQLSRTNYTGAQYTHQGWFTEDHQYFLLGDEVDEQDNGHGTYTYIWDVRDLNNPELIGTYAPGTKAIDHNLYIKDGLVYQSNYTDGLRVLDGSDIANGNMTEIGYFDIYPSSDLPTFNGNWSNYPYFDSGTIAVSGIEQGLYLVKLNAGFLVSADTDTANMCGTDSVDFGISTLATLGYTGNVTLDIMGNPTGMSASFTSNPITAGDSVSMTLTTTDVAAGPYSVNVIASDGTTSNATSLALNILSAPASPELTAPSDGAMLNSQRPLLQWTSTTPAMYLVEIASDDAFTNVVFSGTVSTLYYLPTADLDRFSTYYWRVSANNQCGSEPSATGSFSIAPYGIHLPILHN